MNLLKIAGQILNNLPSRPLKNSLVAAQADHSEKAKQHTWYLKWGPIEFKVTGELWMRQCVGNHSSVSSIALCPSLRLSKYLWCLVKIWVELYGRIERTRCSTSSKDDMALYRMAELRKFVSKKSSLTRLMERARLLARNRLDATLVSVLDWNSRISSCAKVGALSAPWGQPIKALLHSQMLMLEARVLGTNQACYWGINMPVLCMPKSC